MIDDDITLKQAVSSAIPVAEENAASSPTGIGEHLRVRERVSYAVGDFGGNILFTGVGAFILFYLTDYAGLGAAIAGTILLLGRVFDGTMDLLIGALIDKTSTRWGKARPWVLLSTPVVVVSFILLFSIPKGLGETGSAIWAFVFYFLCLGVGFVASNLSYHSLLSLMTTSTRMRVSAEAIRTFCALASGLIVSVITIPVITSFGNSRASWTVLYTVYGLVAALTFLMVFFGTKERTAPKKPENPIRLRTALPTLVRNRYFWIIFVLFILTYGQSALGAVGIYVAKDLLGNPSAFSLLSLTAVVPVLLAMWFIPRLIARYGKRWPIIIGLFVSILGGLFLLIDPHSILILLIGNIIRGLGLVPITISLWASVADTVDYGEWKSGMRLDGMTFAAATAGQNVGAGFGAAAIGWILAAGHYQSATNHIQPISALNAEIFIMVWLPIFATLGTIVAMYFLDLDRKLPTIHADLARRKELAS